MPEYDSVYGGDGPGRQAARKRNFVALLATLCVLLVVFCCAAYFSSPLWAGSLVSTDDGGSPEMVIASNKEPAAQSCDPSPTGQEGVAAEAQPQAPIIHHHHPCDAPCQSPRSDIRTHFASMAPSRRIAIILFVALFLLFILGIAVGVYYKTRSPSIEMEEADATGEYSTPHGRLSVNVIVGIALGVVGVLTLVAVVAERSSQKRVENK